MGKEKAIIYKRVSTNEQAIDGYSLANQEKELRDYCDKNEIEVVEVYADEGLSGSEMENRVGLRNALNHLIYGEDNVKYLMVWKLSRLSRRIIDVLEIIELLNDNGKILISHKDSIDTSRPQDKFLVHFTAIFAEFERDTMIIQVTGGMEQKARQGEWNGGKPPLGYDLLEKRLLINEEQAEIVIEIYKRYLTGEGYLSIAKDLNEKGYKTSVGKNFSSYGVKFILTNPTYKGWVRWGYRKDWGKMHKDPKTGIKQRKRKYSEEPIYVKGKHEAIISEETFQKVQDKIEDNPRRNMKRFQGFNLLSGVLRCPHCGYGMSIAKRTSKGKDYYYYVCNQYQNKKLCTSEGIRQEQIEEEFFRHLDMIIEGKEFQDKITEISVDKDIRVKEVEIDVTRLEENIRKLEREEQRLLDELIYLKKDRQKALIREKLDETSEEVESLLKLIQRKKRELVQIEEEVLDVSEVVGILKNAGKLIKVLEDKETKQVLVRKLIKEINVKDKRISEIIFNYGESFVVNSTGEVVGLENEEGTLSQVILQPLKYYKYSVIVEDNSIKHVKILL